VLAAEGGWSFLTVDIDAPDIILRGPASYRFVLADDPQQRSLGTFRTAVLSAGPLTPARIAAIRSDPRASKAVRVEFACKNCKDRVGAYVALDRQERQETDGYIWYQNLPSEFACTCGGARFSLEIVRANLHALLGRRMGAEGLISAWPLYERSALETVRRNFAELLREGCAEELLQKYIEENPIVLHRFAPTHLFFKAPVLSLRKTDFAVLSPKGELVQIELEKATTPLLKKNGGTHSDLQHAFDQVHEWLHTADEHRLAVLKCIGLKLEDVANVTGCVIAGRDHGNDGEHLRRLKGSDFGKIQFMTYDDLLEGLDALIRDFARL